MRESLYEKLKLTKGVREKKELLEYSKSIKREKFFTKIIKSELNLKNGHARTQSNPE